MCAKMISHFKSLPIGLFVVLKMGAITDDGACTYEKSLVKEFVEQAR